MAAACRHGGGKLMTMLYRSYTPAPPLDSFIEDFWLYDDYAPRHLRERILPSGTLELVINLADDELRIYDRAGPGRCERFSGALVSGTYTSFFVIDTAEETSLIGVHFKPAGAFPFLGLPASELVDTHVDLETVWGPSARDLRERLCAASTAIERFRVLEGALRARLLRPPEHHGAVPFAVEAFSRPGITTVREVTDRVGLSQRRFIEVFKTEVGLTPKGFQRVQRFQRMLARLGKAPGLDWADLALDGGFFDQSHLIHDFVAFSGFTPARFHRHQQELRRRGVHLKRHHLPLPDDHAMSESGLVKFFQYDHDPTRNTEPSPVPRDRHGRPAARYSNAEEGQ